MGFIYAKLRGRIIEKYRTYENFADALGSSTVTVSKKLNGKTDFSQADIIKWSAALGIEELEIGAYFFN